MADEDELKQPVYEDDEGEGGVFRWMSAVVVLLAVAGFFGLAWYAYKNGGETVDEKDVELIKADTTPVKVAPANPGGMQIPNQDKTVYGLISGKSEKPVVERILPAPEEPMQRTQVADDTHAAKSDDTQTWMSDSLKNKSGNDTETVKVAAAAADSDTTPAPKEQFNPAKVRAAETPAPTPAAVAPLPAAAPTPAPAAAPPPAAPKPAPAPAAKNTDDADDSDEKPQAKPDTATATPPAGVRAQLGAYKSQAEAEKNWTKIASDFSDDVKGKQHYVVRADLGSKGVYYRLQLAPFASSGAAEDFCLNLVSAGQGCIATKGK